MKENTKTFCRFIGSNETRKNQSNFVKLNDFAVMDKLLPDDYVKFPTGIWKVTNLARKETLLSGRKAYKIGTNTGYAFPPNCFWKAMDDYRKLVQVKKKKPPEHAQGNNMVYCYKGIWLLSYQIKKSSFRIEEKAGFWVKQSEFERIMNEYSKRTYQKFLKLFPNKSDSYIEPLSNISAQLALSLVFVQSTKKGDEV